MTLEEKQSALKKIVKVKTKKKKAAIKALQPKPVKNINDFPIKHQALQILTDNGMDTKTAGKALSYKGESVYDAKSKLNKYLITGSDKLLKSAHQALKLMIKGETFGEIKEIKDSTVLQASKMIYDRVDPVIQQVETRNITIKAVIDLSEVK